MYEIKVVADYGDSMVVINLMHAVNSALSEVEVPWRFEQDDKVHDGQEVFFLRNSDV